MPLEIDPSRVASAVSDISREANPTRLPAFAAWWARNVPTAVLPIDVDPAISVNSPA